jgi:nickel-dependent lactate racemase
MKTVNLDYGDSKIMVELPDSAMVIRYGETYKDPPSVDPKNATIEALRNPLGLPPLRDLAGKNTKIVIGFPDRVKGGIHLESHRRTAIPLIIEELLAGGAKKDNITLLCAVGLHRQNTLDEWYWYLGKNIVDFAYPDRLINHDSESSDLVDLGTDAMGNVVQVSRILAEADIPIILGHVSGNPYGGFSGGYKMLVTGHSGWRSIASHHCPGTMHRDDWLGASTDQYMRRQFKSIGQTIEERIGKKIFAIDAVIGQHSQILQVSAGALELVEEATWPLAKRRTNIELSMKDKADVLIMGLPRNFHYGPGMGTNPILMGLAISGQLSRCWNAFNEGGVVIAVSVCDGWFNDFWFPSYEETYNKWQQYSDTESFLASDDMIDIAVNPEYCYAYSNRYTYHPFHAMSMISGASVVPKRTRARYIVGAKKPQFARGLQYTPTDSIEQALMDAKRYVGNNPKIICTPEAFSGGVGVHLFAKG